MTWQSNDGDFLATDLKHDIENRLVDAIKEAQASVEISIYSLNDSKVLEALKQKAEAGVKVQVVLDAATTPYAVKKLGPNVHTTLYQSRGLMHHKIMLLDGEELWLGSANLTSDSLRVHSNLVHKLKCPELCHFVHEKLMAMHSEGLKRKFPHKSFKINDQNLEMWFLPDDQMASERILELIHSAQKTIQVAMYTFTRLDFAKSLIEKAHAGIQVEVIMDNGMAEGVCKKVVNAFQGTDVKLYASAGKALLHNKMMVVDGKILEHGSANWTKAAFTQNDDYFIVLYDLKADQQQALVNLWQALLNRSQRHPSNLRSSDMEKWDAWWKFPLLQEIIRSLKSTKPTFASTLPIPTSPSKM